MTDPARQLRGAERDRLIVERRAARASFADIGTELGITAQRVHQLWQRTLDRLPVQALDEHRAEEIALIDRAQADLLARLAANPAASLRTAAEVWTTIRGWSEHRARLLGLYAPTRARVEVLTSDTVQEAIGELLDKMQEDDPEALAALGNLDDFLPMLNGHVK